MMTKDSFNNFSKFKMSSSTTPTSSSFNKKIFKSKSIVKIKSKSKMMMMMNVITLLFVIFSLLDSTNCQRPSSSIFKLTNKNLSSSSTMTASFSSHQPKTTNNNNGFPLNNHINETILQHSYNIRHKRTPAFEATLNAMKCALRIVGQQVSEHHNNMLMCCGLWKMKQFMKNTADEVCEDSDTSKKVFDDFINDELIYGKFTHSILGDDTLDCKHYPEGSIKCERLWTVITLILVIIIWLLIMLIIGCCITSVCYYRYRKRYTHLLKCKLSDLDQTEKDLLMMDQQKIHLNNKERRTPNWVKNLRTLLPSNKYTDDDDIDNDQLTIKKRKNNNDINSRLTFPSNGKTDGKNSAPSSVLYKSDSVQMISDGNNGTGKSTPDSAVPPSTNSNATSQNTSTISLNDASNGNGHQQSSTGK